MVQLFGLQGKGALVIGGGLGIGEACALNLARAGCDVAVMDIDLERAEQVTGKIRQLGREAWPIEADALDSAELAAAIRRADSEMGGIDAMVTVVGNACWTPVLDLALDDWDTDHRRNLRYAFIAAQTTARAMVERDRPGAITLIASVSGQQSAPMHAAYGAAKAGLINLAKTMAVELARHGIRVNTIAPGIIRTPRTAEAPNIREWEDQVASSLIPFRRMGAPEDIGNAALFLSSELAGYISGHTLNVDGGWTAAFLLAPSDTQPREV
jgi:NAD(P)-dependent dehydrogenase (short-subunit alcohol dehydrogenase family)